MMGKLYRLGLSKRTAFELTDIISIWSRKSERGIRSGTKRINGWEYTQWMSLQEINRYRKLQEFSVCVEIITTDKIGKSIIPNIFAPPSAVMGSKGNPRYVPLGTLVDEPGRFPTLSIHPLHPTTTPQFFSSSG